MRFDYYLLTTFINGNYFSILLSVFKFAWLASFGLKFSFGVLNFSLKDEARQANLNTDKKNTKIASTYESGLCSLRI